MLRPTSYTSQKGSWQGLIKEARFLYTTRSERVARHVSTVLDRLALLEHYLGSRYGLALRNFDVLDIGTGQYLGHMFHFAQHNRVVGIDWDVIAQGVNPASYVAMLLSNGPRRTAKTIIRKIVGVDREYRREIKNRLKLNSLPPLRVYRMDAARMTFPDESFDLAHSSAVFHHLPNPEAAAGEAARVLRPGGVSCISFHLFTSENGSLDPREFKDDAGNFIRWPHLRAPWAEQIRYPAYLNKLRLSAWRELFSRRMPGAEFVLNPAWRAGAEQDANTLIENGQLAGFTPEELLVHDVTVLWRKPAKSAQAQRQVSLRQDDIKNRVESTLA